MSNIATDTFTFSPSFHRCVQSESLATILVLGVRCWKISSIDIARNAPEHARSCGRGEHSCARLGVPKHGQCEIECAV